MRTLLVTGGCGFIGNHFVRMALGTGAWRVVNRKLTYAGNPENVADALESPHYRFIRGDIADRQGVRALLTKERPGPSLTLPPSPA